MSKVITGFHAIEEKVLSFAKAKERGSKETPQMEIFYSKPGPRVKKILSAAKECGIGCSQVDDKSLDGKVTELPEALRDHRGIVMVVAGEKTAAVNLVNLDDWIKENCVDKADEEGNKPLTVMILDRVTDPHNVGAIIRSCDQFGASLVIIPSHNSANDIEGNEVIARTSAGSSAWVPVAIVNNLVRAAEQLKEAGFWVYGADAGGLTLGKIDFPARTCLIMGSEGTGLSQLLEKKCDEIVSIPTCGKIDSLNVSVAAGVLLYEVYRRQN